MALKLYLKPHEKIIINQAVIVNGGSKSEILLENQANVLREKDVLSEQEANTPAKRVYFAVQLLYLFPEEQEKNLRQAAIFLDDFLQAAPSSVNHIDAIRLAVGRAEYYTALKKGKELIEYEAKLMENVQEPV